MTISMDGSRSDLFVDIVGFIFKNNQIMVFSLFYNQVRDLLNVGVVFTAWKYFELLCPNPGLRWFYDAIINYHMQPHSLD